MEYLLLASLVPHYGSQIILGVLAYIVLAVSVLYLWHKEPSVKNLSEPSEWAAAIVASVLMGVSDLGWTYSSEDLPAQVVAY